jgi:hypothetical protein
MKQDMFPGRQIGEAVADLLAGRVRVAGAVEKGATELQVGSNNLFSVGDAVALSHSRWTEVRGEFGVVAKKTGLTSITLAEPALYDRAAEEVCHLYLKERGDDAWQPRAVPSVSFVDLAALGAGGCLAVIVRGLKMSGSKGSMISQQDWEIVVRYRAYYHKEADARRFGAECESIFNTLMADTYLGGTCWSSGVVDFRTSEEHVKHGSPRASAEFTIIAKRAAVIQQN